MRIVWGRALVLCNLCPNSLRVGLLVSGGSMRMSRTRDLLDCQTRQTIQLGRGIDGWTWRQYRRSWHRGADTAHKRHSRGSLCNSLVHTTGRMHVAQ